MKKALHILKGKDLEWVEVAATRWGTFVLMVALSELDLGPPGSAIKIKLPTEVLRKLLKECDFAVTKKRTWWWVDEIKRA